MKQGLRLSFETGATLFHQKHFIKTNPFGPPITDPVRQNRVLEKNVTEHETLLPRRGFRGRQAKPVSYLMNIILREATKSPAIIRTIYGPDAAATPFLSKPFHTTTFVPRSIFWLNRV